MGPQIYRDGQRFIIPTSDWGFKRLFGSEMNKGLLIGLLNKIIDDKVIEDLEYLDRDIILPVGDVRKMSFDVYCKCADGSRIIVEMQNYAKSSFVDRALVYSSASIIENYTLSKAKGYRVQKTYFIAITGEKVFPQVDHAPVRLAMCGIDLPERPVLNDKILQIFIELPKFADDLNGLKKDSPFLNKFAVALKTMASYSERPKVMDDATLVDMFKAADLHGYEEVDLSNYKTSVMNEFEYEETLKEYREEGLADGLAQGLEEGRADSSREIAANMKKAGITPDIIAKCAGLSIDEIKTL